MAMMFAEQNAMVLRTLLKNHEDWKYDIEFSKIVEKIKDGKKLKKREFTKIHWFLWEKGR